MAKYQFVGKGRGIPGLPHEITDEQAKQLDLREVLEAALKNGNYVKLEEVKPAKKAEDKE